MCSLEKTLVRSKRRCRVQSTDFAECVTGRGVGGGLSSKGLSALIKLKADLEAQERGGGRGGGGGEGGGGGDQEKFY
jgi:hypothetical protein